LKLEIIVVKCEIAQNNSLFEFRYATAL